MHGKMTIGLQEQFQWKQCVKACYSVLRKIIGEQLKQQQTTKIITWQLKQN